MFFLVVPAVSSQGYAAVSEPTAQRETQSSHQGPAGDPAVLRANEQSTGNVGGTVVDSSGTPVVGAQVAIFPGNAAARSLGPGATSTGTDGRFFLSNVPAGTFELTITADGFASKTTQSSAPAGDVLEMGRIVLSVAAVKTEVRVSASSFEVAEAQVKAEEKQRVLGLIPNFYVSFVPDAAPLAPRQKFRLAWKTAIDPVTFGLVAGFAGVEQARNDYPGFGRGAQGYGKRFGAAYATDVTALFLGNAILPTVFKQDPRYFYKGKGSVRSRALYALANAFICKGDNGRWQPNYSNILGDLGSGAISNLYYPPENRNGAKLTIENGLLEIGTSAAFNLIEEFILPKLTSHRPDRAAPAP